MNKKIKKNLSILLISFLTLIFIYNQNLFRKVYNIVNLTYEDRISQVSGFCSEDSVGYLTYLKKNLILILILKFITMKILFQVLIGQYMIIVLRMIQNIKFF